MKGPAVHRAQSVSIEGSNVPACGVNGWRTTEDWELVDCKRCLRNRSAIDAKNARLVAWFLSQVST